MYKLLHMFAHMIAGLAALMLLSGCSAMWSGGGYGTRGGVSSSLVDYLYPKGEVPPEQIDTIPQLELPLRVGIAFVPTANAWNDISEATKKGLLDDVSDAFIAREYIEHIEVIPNTYLRSSTGIGGMQQVARLYGVDVMALVSYDQLTVREDNAASILYWTIVGAYFVPGTDNAVQTFVDTAVFDAATARLLFRAPGVDNREGRSTGVNVDEALRRGTEAGFTAAMDDMTGNLATELDDFELRVEENPTLADVSWKPSHGGGAVSTVTLVLLIGSALLFRRRRV